MTFGVVRSLLVTLIAVACTAQSPRSETGASTTSTRADTAPIFSPIHPLSTDDERVAGDPAAAGPFVIRTRELAGTIVPVHTHPFDENLTVVAGTWYFGIGPRFDSTALRPLPTGSFVFVPRGTPMFAYSPDPVTVQIHGIGPFVQRWADSLFTLSDSDNTGGRVGSAPGRFRFHLGDRVSTPRGSGRIEEGYAVGPFVEYRLATTDGQLFMVLERDIRPQRP